jgi:putative dimethyl sulfoxide reductase chaperone
LQSGISTAVARAFLYRLLAAAFQDPEEENWQALATPDFQAALTSATQDLGRESPVLGEAARAWARTLAATSFEEFHLECLAAFGHAARGCCPLNEIDYGDLKADPLFQPHRLADLAAFYRAFGLELAQAADERHDHLCLELEFMAVLAAKEAYALEHQFDDDLLLQCRAAQKQFLREHLGRWTPAFARRLAQQSAPGTLRALADFLRVFIEADCARWQLRPGSEDLLLRPVDDAAESACATCGLSGPVPGACELPAEP